MGKEGAGHRAWETRRLNDAHRVRDLYRQGFSSEPKDVARKRAIRALRAAGGTVCLDLWGGGTSALAELEAGFSVISVDDGSLALVGVSGPRKRLALETTAREDRYEARWGKVPKFAREADVAFLDFCGPWTPDVRRAIEACRHMSAVVVTLMTDHDMATEATIQEERRIAYEAWLRRAFGVPNFRRRLASYKRPGGQPVWVYVLSRVRLGTLSPMYAESVALHPEMRAIYSARRRAYVLAHPDVIAGVECRRREHQKQVRSTPEYKAAKNAARRERWANDPEYRIRSQRQHNAWNAKSRAREALVGTGGRAEAGQ